MKRILFITEVLLLAFMPVVVFADYDRDQLIAELTTQIKVLQERLDILIAELAIPKISIDLTVNGSDGPVTIPYNSAVTLSWKLSDHNWSYCTKLGSWSGGIKAVSGSEKISNLTYAQVYTLYCYIDSTRYSDSVTVSVAPETKKTEAKSEPTPSAVISSACSLSVSKSLVTVGKDAIEATWVIKSDPPGWPFYWHGTDNGKEISHYYGGTTDAIITLPYNNTPVTYTRYFEVVQAVGFVVQDSNHPKPSCTSNTVTFEIKAFSSREAAKRFVANALNAVTSLFKWFSK